MPSPGIRTSKADGQAVSWPPWDSGPSCSLPTSPPFSSPCLRPRHPFPWLAAGFLFTLSSSGINCQPHSGAVTSPSLCQGPYPLGVSALPPHSGSSGLRLSSGSLPCLHPSLELQRGADSPGCSAACLLPRGTHRTPVQTYPQQPVLTCLPVLAREFLLPAKFISFASRGSWLPGPVRYLSLLPFEQRVIVVSIFYPTLFSK